MKFRTKLFILNVVPLVIFVAISLLLGLAQFRHSLYNEKEGNLRSTALAALTLYASQGYGDYQRQPDGFIWRGMNLNISERTGIVDDLKKQTGVDITFFFGTKAVMTSIQDGDGRRCLGLTAGDAIREYTLEQGSQLWCRRLLINGETCQAYVIPIRQESDDSVVGALMASESAAGFNAAIRRYVLTMVATLLLVLMAVLLFIRWHVEWFAQKFTEVADRSRQDLLTGLYNKLTFEDEVSKILAKRQPNEPVVLMLLDLDDFKMINDQYGHQAGDEVLKAFSSILLRAFRTHDVLGRVGGDEFMVFMRDMRCNDFCRADELAREILDSFHEIKLGGAHHLTCSIGIGTDNTGCDFHTLYGLADKALYAAKEKGKANFVRLASENEKA